MMVIGFFNTLLRLTESVPEPPFNETVPRGFSTSFFFFSLTFTWTSKVAVPVGTPAPGAIGSATAFRPRDTSLCFFLKTGSGMRTTWVAARVTDRMPGT